MQSDDAIIPMDWTARGFEEGSVSRTLSVKPVRSMIADDMPDAPDLVGTGTDEQDGMPTSIGEGDKEGVVSRLGACALDDEVKGNAGDCSKRYCVGLTP